MHADYKDAKPVGGIYSTGISVFLHVFVILSAFLFSFAANFFEPKADETPLVDMSFDMLTDAQVKQMQELPPPPPQDALNPNFDVKKLPDVKPIDLPPEPKPAPEPSPKPKPEPKPTENLKPVDTPKPPEKKSFKDFQKEHGEPKPRQTKPVASNKPVNIEGIKNVGASLTTTVRSDFSASRYASASASELGAYASLISSITKRSWVVPEELMGMVLEARVKLSINAFGKVTNVRFERRSSSKTFDASIDNFFKSQTFPAPPKGEAIVVNLNLSARD